MMDYLKKTMFTGIGMALLTKEKIEEMGRDLIAKGAIPEQEGKDFIEEALVKSREAKESLKEQIEKIIRDTLKKMNVVTEDELKDLKARIAKLEKAEKPSGKKK